MYVCACYPWTCQAWLCTSLYNRCWIAQQRLHRTNKLVALEKMEDIGLFSGAIQIINLCAWTCCSLWFVDVEDLELKGFYFFNCFDTDNTENISCWLWLFCFTHHIGMNTVSAVWGVAEEGRVDEAVFLSFIVSSVTPLFSLYCCSSESCEHFPTNAIKYGI